MNRLPFSLIVAAVCLLPISNWADTLVIKIGTQGMMADKLPHRGQSAAQVLAGFGPPLARLEGVGTPIIHRWNYPEFIVVFENETVIHSVLRHKSALERPVEANQP